MRKRFVTETLGYVGFLLIIAAGFGLAGVVLSWMEFGTWTEVLTWGGIGSATLAAVGAACIAVSVLSERGTCWRRRHAWSEVRVVKDAKLLDEVSYVVREAEWRVQCERCGRDSGRSLREPSTIQQREDA
jgi:hypothetical protein